MKAATKTRPRAAKAKQAKPERMDLAQFVPRRGSFAQRASYDAARNSPDFARVWENADAFDADSANSREVRHTLMRRSRYEVANNGYSDGIAQTSATDLIGVGPSLRMQTGSEGFNRMVENQWFAWCKAIKFRRKLWCMAHAKHVDGEAIAAMKANGKVKHPVQLDIILYEAEQCQTPMPPIGDPNYIDGIKFDDFGNPLWYDILAVHPGSTNPNSFTMQAQRVAADLILHWFRLRRPGQHRAVPECASTLQLGAAFRRLREASLATAEKVAAWTMFLKTLYQPDSSELESVTPMSTLDIVHGMMTALPNTVEPVQLKAEQPGPNYDTFHRSLLNEQARPKNMPFNKAACDSSSYNYASGRLDHQTYYAALDVEREDCNDLVLDQLFDVWFNLAVRVFGWLGGDPDLVSANARSHLWDWPKHRVADVQAEADANETKLKSGQISLYRLYAESGMDLADEIAQSAQSFGVNEQVIRERLLNITLPEESSPQRDLVEAIQKIYLGVGRVISPEEAREILRTEYGAELSSTPPAGLGPANPTPPSDAEAVAAMLVRRGVSLAKNTNGKGTVHAN